MLLGYTTGQITWSRDHHKSDLKRLRSVTHLSLVNHTRFRWVTDQEVLSYSTILWSHTTLQKSKLIVVLANYLVITVA